MSEKAHWLIWSGEHGAYWGEDRGGYYTSVRSAGRYTRTEAAEIASGCGPDKLIEIKPAPESFPSFELAADALKAAASGLNHVELFAALRLSERDMRDAIRRIERAGPPEDTDLYEQDMWTTP